LYTNLPDTSDGARARKRALLEQDQFLFKDVKRFKPIQPPLSLSY
jgi:hypothetical protein